MHATTISLEGYGIMICGAAGIGKSALALDLLNDAHGFDYVLVNSCNNYLVADDQTYVGITKLEGKNQLIARCPKTIEGLFEVRGLGLINLPFKSPAALHLYIEIIDRLPVRMPEPSDLSRQILGVDIAFLQIYKDDKNAKARVKAALYALLRNKVIST